MENQKRLEALACYVLIRQSHEVKSAHEVCRNECIIQHKKYRPLEIQDNQKGICKYFKKTHSLLTLPVVSKRLYKYVKLYLSQLQKNRIVCLAILHYACYVVIQVDYNNYITILHSSLLR